MKRWFYTKLAWTGIKKNQQLYKPYLIAGMTMVMVFYILAFLGASEVAHSLPGGEAVTQVLIYGSWAIGVLSLPFLFYTSSALIKKRKRELGLYNILGMNKRNILVILLWENLITYGIAVLLGLCLGILFSKAAELGLVFVMGKETDYRIYIEWKAVLSAFLMYAVIYLLIFLNTLRQIRHNNPMELFKSESAGERPPKSRWPLAAAGILLTVSAYVMAILTKKPQEAFSRCFLIAAMIAAGTYLLFIAGSVFLCRLLQKKNGYYYQTAHFVTISSLSYRMKRNGAGLASICILALMILVALTGTVGFYTGADSIVEGHYPYDLSVSVEIPEGSGAAAEAAIYQAKLEAVLEENHADVQEVFSAYSVGITVPVTDGVLDLSFDLMGEAPEEGNVEAWDAFLEPFCAVRVLSLEEYNRLCGTEETLESGEVLLAGGNVRNSIETVRSWDGSEYHVKTRESRVPELSVFEMFDGYMDLMMDEVYLVVSDMDSFWEGFDASQWLSKNQVLFLWEYDANLNEDHDRQLAIGSEAESRIAGAVQAGGGAYYTSYTKAEKGDRLKGLSGGLMFLAVIISAVFVFIATLIMYYKQISEGYEDQKQFSIMRKIGMTKREIKRCINSQMLTVFCFPLLEAGIHLVFLFPIIYQLIKYAVLDDMGLLIKVAVISFLLFAAAYSLVYLLTTKTYFRIVNRPVNE